MTPHRHPFCRVHLHHTSHYALSAQMLHIQPGNLIINNKYNNNYTFYVGLMNFLQTSPQFMRSSSDFLHVCLFIAGKRSHRTSAVFEHILTQPWFLQFCFKSAPFITGSNLFKWFWILVISLTRTTYLPRCVVKTEDGGQANVKVLLLRKIQSRPNRMWERHHPSTVCHWMVKIFTFNVSNSNF